MSKPALRFLAVLLTFLIILVLAAGLDDLPSGLRDRIDTAQQELTRSRAQFERERGEVEQALRSEPELFLVGSMASAFPERFRKAGHHLKDAEQDMAALAALRKANRREDRGKAEQLLSHEERLRGDAIHEADAVHREAKRWLGYKQNLPALLESIERDHRAVEAAPVDSVAALVERTAADWPEKRADLRARLEALQALKAGGESAWQSTAEARPRAASGKIAGPELALLVEAAESLRKAVVELPRQAGEIGGLAAQLYTSWDRILVDLEERRFGRSRDYFQKIRTVRTRLTGVASKESETTSDERWVEVSRADFQALEKNLGMALEHKPAGRYDSEAERVPQPAGFAYMAPPSERSNQYGYWERRDGQSFWVFYGQYALLRDLLFNRQYQAPNPADYQGYRASRSSGSTYYGRDQATGAPKYGSGASGTQSRYSGSTYMRSGGGFRESQYATRSGGYRGSRYEDHGWTVPARPRDSSSFGRSPKPRPPSRSLGGGGGRRFGTGGRRR